jgi:FkbM family methyltransferase
MEKRKRMPGFINSLAGNFYSTGRNIVGTLGLRQHYFGRKLIAALNKMGCLATRYILLSRRRPSFIEGHNMYLTNDASPSLSFSTKMLLGGYERETVLLMERVIERGMTVVDIGAHVGFHSLLAAKRVGPSGRVFAFEPDPDNFAILKRNIALNNYENITPVQQAVSDRTGRLELFLSGQGNDRHSIYPNPRDLSSGRTWEVTATCLDDFLASEGWPQIDFIKMDIEGAEPLALKGMNQLLKRSENLRILSEFAPESLRAGGHAPAQFLEELALLGFTVNWLDDSGELKHLARKDFSGYATDSERLGVVNLYCDKKQALREAQGEDSAAARQANFGKGVGSSLDLVSRGDWAK